MRGYQPLCVALSLSCWLESVGVYNVIQCQLRGGESCVAINLCVLLSLSCWLESVGASVCRY